MDGLAMGLFGKDTAGYGLQGVYLGWSERLGEDFAEGVREALVGGTDSGESARLAKGVG